MCFRLVVGISLSLLYIDPSGDTCHKQQRGSTNNTVTTIFWMLTHGVEGWAALDHSGLLMS